MPITTIGNIITGNIPVLTSYLTQDPVEKTAFFESGILSPTPYAAEIARGPSNIANIPYWKSIDASIEPNYSNDVYADVADRRGGTWCAHRTSRHPRRYMALCPRRKAQRCGWPLPVAPFAP